MEAGWDAEPRNPLTRYHPMRPFLIIALFISLIGADCPALAQTASLKPLRRDLEDLAFELLRNPDGSELRDPAMGPLYEALVRLSSHTGDPRYLAEVLRFGDMAGWQRGPSNDGPGWNVAEVWERVAALDEDGGYRQRLIRECLGTRGAVETALPQRLDPASRDVDALAFLALAREMEMSGSHVPQEDATQALQVAVVSLLAKRDPQGLWAADVLPSSIGRTGPLTPTAIVCLGTAIGTRLGVLDRETHLEGLMDIRSTVSRQRIDLNRYAPWEQALLLAAGAELYGLARDGGVDRATLLARAEEHYRADQAPRAQALFVPQRKDDLAWENDRVANRVYGPALADSTEDSGMDAWIKRVAYPILEKWYRRDLAGEQSYHEDTGEGYDGYKVGSRRGCGGAGIWEEGRVLTSNVFENHAIYWTSPQEAHFAVWYSYPNRIQEKKSMRIRMGSPFTEVTSVFTDEGRPMGGLSVAIGLSAQTAEGSSRWDLSAGELDRDDVLGTEILRTMVRWDPDRQPGAHEAQTGSGKNADFLVILETDHLGQLSYKVGHMLIGMPHAHEK